MSPTKYLFVFINLILLSLIFKSCSDSYTQENIKLHPEKTELQTHVGQGVYMAIPGGYKKAKSYEGFQTNNGHSSFSVKTTYSSLEEVKSNFDPKNLKNKGISLLELSTVEFGENKKAFFSVVHDKRKSTVRYLLSINDGVKTFNIKAFCLHYMQESFDAAIREALFSTYIGEKIKEEELFILARVIDTKNFIFSRDGKFPTEAKDNSIIEIVNITTNYGSSEKAFVENELRKLTSNKTVRVLKEDMLNGRHYYGSSSDEEKKAYIAFISVDNNDGLLIKCYGNKESSISDFKLFINRKYLKLKIG